MGTVNFLTEHYNQFQAMPMAVSPDVAIDGVVSALVAAHLESVSRAASGNENACEDLRRIMGEIIDTQRIAVRGVSRDIFINQVFSSIYGYGILHDLIEDPLVTDIFVNRPDDIWMLRNFKMEKVFRTFRNEDELLRFMHRILAACGRKINEMTPCIDARNTQRRLHINCVVRPINTRGHSIVIRKHPLEHLTLEDLVAGGMFTDEMSEFFRKLVVSRSNIIVSGPTGSGKTTFMRCMTSHIPESERIITIEDTEELYLAHPNCVAQETRKKQGESDVAVTMAQLVTNALRMRPDRIILGELRNAETVNLLDAFGTGRASGFATVHANSSNHVISRLVFLMLYSEITLRRPELLEFISEAVDAIIHVERNRVVNVSEVTGFDYRKESVSLNTIFRFDKESETSGFLTGTFSKHNAIGQRLAQKFRTAGLEHKGGVDAGFRVVL
ncbi:MAG: putative conjugal transfer protein [Syntrophomonadaceae bacterium]|nr:putative conjugal transfer protein [Bacillota bacterium]